MHFPADIFTEPGDVDPDTLANLGPLGRLAGRWSARKGVDVNPKADGPERRVFIERIDFDPIDPQTNGPQLFYSLRYHIHITTEEDAPGASDRDPAVIARPEGPRQSRGGIRYRFWIASSLRSSR